MLRRELPQAHRTHPAWQAMVVLALTLLAFGLRTFRLDHQSLWLDETISAYLASQPPVQIILNRANSLHPPTYFLALAGWTTLVGRSEFSLRFFSVWTGLLLIPLLYRACRCLFADARTALLAALLAALSPAGVVYAQETRMYVMLPVAYLVILIQVLASNGLRRRRDWIWFAVSEIVCLYLHVFSAFILLAVNLLLLATRLQRASRRTWRRWAVSQVSVGLSFVPWLLTVQRWGSEVPGKLSRHDWRAAGMGLTRFLRLLWEFLNSGLVDVGEIDVLEHLLGVWGVLLPLALLLALLLDRRRRTLLAVAGGFLLPLLGSYPVWYMRPLAHPRYVLFLLAPLLIVSARVLATLLQGPATGLLSVALMGVIVGSDVVALNHAFFDTRFFRPDVRALAATVGERATPNEAVLMPPGDYSLWYYDPAPAEPVNLPGEIGAEGGRLRPHELGPLLADRPGAFLVTYEELRSVDPRNQMPFLLETNGRLIERFSVDRVDVNHYELGQHWTLPELTPVTATCGPLTLTGVYSQAVAEADNAVTMALRWRLSQPTTSNYKVTVQLWDDGREIAANDVRLLNKSGRPASFWEPGEEAVNTYVLPLPLGTPPLTYSLRAGVYGGPHSTWQTGEEWLALGKVKLRQAVGQTSDPYGSWAETEWFTPAVPEVAKGLLLEGYAVRPETPKPGDVLYISLRWRAVDDDLSHYAPALVLRQDDTVLDRDSGTLFERYSTAHWAAGELLIETRQLWMPPTLNPLELALEIGSDVSPIGKIAVAKDALLWELPADAQPVRARLDDVAELTGYKWTLGSEKPGSGTLMLYWRASSQMPAATSYTVFTHLLSPDGRLIAQRDSIPQGGQRPTTTWLPGEIIADRHELLISEPYAGPAHLRVGMYDLTTMERLPAYGCKGQRYPEDAIPLAEIVVEKEP